MVTLFVMWVIKLGVESMVNPFEFERHNPVGTIAHWIPGDLVFTGQRWQEIVYVYGSVILAGVPGDYCQITASTHHIVYR